MKRLDQRKAAAAARRILFHLRERVLASSPGKIPGWCIYAKPYLLAIATDDYGLEDPATCALYALDNLTSWRGEEARICKKMLHEALYD